jgi:hypothetical protein
MRDRLLEPGDAFVVFAHGFPRLAVPVTVLPYHIHMKDTGRAGAILRFAQKRVNRAGLSSLNWEK